MLLGASVSFAAIAASETLLIGLIVAVVVDYDCPELDHQPRPESPCPHVHHGLIAARSRDGGFAGYCMPRPNREWNSTLVKQIP